jgi:hypothetical protein
MAAPHLHEDLTRDDEVGAGPSDRSVGLVFAAVFAIIGALPLLAGRGPRWWSLGIALAFLALALLLPTVLAPLNRAWMRFGLLLHRVVNPVVMGLLFVLGVIPFGLGARLMGKDLLRLKLDKSAKSYWIVRQPPGPPPETMRNQY